MREHHRTRFGGALAALALLVVAWPGSPETDETKPPVSLTYSGEVSTEILQIVKTSVVPSPLASPAEDSSLLSGAVLGAVTGRLDLSARVHERLTLNVGYMADIWHDVSEEGVEAGGDRRRVSSGPTAANAVLAAGNPDSPSATFTLGYFNYRYAPEVQDLGEYLFNSGTYPGFIFSGGHGSYLVGLHVRLAGSNMPRMPGALKPLTLDAFLTSEINIVPNYDYSPSIVVRYDIRKALSLGVGVMFNRLLSVNRENTTPPQHAPYTHAGTKAMARFCFDPRALLPEGRLGAEDLKLYAEAAVLGVEDYPVFYEDIAERVPVMCGFNVPAFGLLDVVAVEIEWYGSPHTNNPYNDGVPVPQPRYNGVNYPGSRDDLKWVVTARKTLLQKLTVSARAASDHLRTDRGVGWTGGEERLEAPDQWYWQIALSFGF